MIIYDFWLWWIDDWSNTDRWSMNHCHYSFMDRFMYCVNYYWLHAPISYLLLSGVCKTYVILNSIFSHAFYHPNLFWSTYTKWSLSVSLCKNQALSETQYMYMKKKHHFESLIWRFAPLESRKKKQIYNIILVNWEMISLDCAENEHFMADRLLYQKLHFLTIYWNISEQIQ